ncbi:MAG: carbohydrate kinase family protein [Thioalkalivibrionaceae bacterium]
MSALISGSLAFDTIMVFQDRFRNHILPDKVHLLNVSFLVPEMRREYGGCAGNIAYNLRLLGGDPLIVATAGRDFASYSDWLDRHQIPKDFVLELDDYFTGQAFITTDQDDNQITAFHPGAMGEAHRIDIPTGTGASIGIVAPNGRQGMIDHAAQLKAAGIPFIFDPGQGLPMFNADELLAFLDQATWCALNDYEAALVVEKTGLDFEQLAERVSALIVTRGAQGSTVLTQNEQIDIPPVTARDIRDPTGCGDAYRAALLLGLERGLPWTVIGRVASLIGAIKIEHLGPQNHRFTQAEFAERYLKAFGEPLVGFFDDI